jgi:hypothetical protein
VCLIVDTNVAHRVFLIDSDESFSEVHRRLVGGAAASPTLVYGGKLRSEYAKNRRVLALVVELDRAGRARSVPDAVVNALAARITQTQACRSDDQHVLALAKVSGARLLVTDDGALQSDFGDPALIRQPRGKVYKNARHNRLLDRRCARCL